jgi:ABC-type nickel/cobalt efflux system permease component RcnA
MMDYSNAGFLALMAATFILATTHTISPDHWFPFVMVGRANKWKISWVLGLAILAGLGHVGTSAIIGLMGVFAKTGSAKDFALLLENATPVLLMLFGFGYATYTFYKQFVGSHSHSHGIPIINKWLGIDPHNYVFAGSERHHDHDKGEESDHHTHSHTWMEHEYVHNHQQHKHIHNSNHHTHNHNSYDLTKITLKNKKAGWGLVAILGLTPCIALLPLTFASVKYGILAIILVNVCFAVATIGTIMLFTWLGLMGLSWIKLEFFDRNGDIIAGIIIGFLGLATKVFGL